MPLEQSEIVAPAQLLVAPTSAADGSSLVSARDICIPFRLNIGRVLFAFVLATMTAAHLSRTLGVGIALVTPFVVLVLVALEFVTERFKRAAVLRTLAKHAAALRNATPTDVDVLLAHTLRNYATLAVASACSVLGQSRLLHSVARHLAASGRCGIHYRFAGYLADLPALEPPLQVPFLPTALHASASLTGDPQAETTTRRYLEDMESALGRFVKAKWAQCVYWGALGGLLLFLVVQLLSAAQELARGQVPSMLRPILIGFASVAPFVFLRFVFPQAWFLVPGGIVVRTARWSAATWELHLFRRDDSVLIYWRDFERLAVARADGQGFVVRIKPATAKMAYRAWASPLEPPPLDRLSDLR